MKEWFDTLQDETEFKKKKVPRERSETRFNTDSNLETSTTKNKKVNLIRDHRINKKQKSNSFYMTEKTKGSKLNSSLETEPKWLSSQKYKLRERQSLQRYDKIIKKYNS